MYSVCTERLEGPRSFSGRGRWASKTRNIVAYRRRVERDSWNSPFASKWQISSPPQTAVLRQFFYDTFQRPPTPHLSWKDPAVHYVFFYIYTARVNRTLVLLFAKRRRQSDSDRGAWELSTHIFKKKHKKQKRQKKKQQQQTLAHVMYLSSPSAVTIIAM